MIGKLWVGTNPGWPLGEPPNSWKKYEIANRQIARGEIMEGQGVSCGQHKHTLYLNVAQGSTLKVECMISLLS